MVKLGWPDCTLVSYHESSSRSTAENGSTYVEAHARRVLSVFIVAQNLVVVKIRLHELGSDRYWAVLNTL